MKDYCEWVDKALGTRMSPHRTLRTCLDPGSSEWNNTTMEKKVEILKKVAAVKDLTVVFLAYKKAYRDMNKPHVTDALEDGLTELLKHFLDEV